MATKNQTTKKPAQAKANKPMETTIIRLQWDRESYPMSDFTKKKKPLMNARKDWGCYQIYGQHPVYGSDALLYIGICGNSGEVVQTFGTRLSQHSLYHDDPYYCDARVYVGRLIGEDHNKATKSAQQKWSDHIRWAEKLLVFFHQPAMNSYLIKNISDEVLWKNNVRVMNVGNFRKLQCEVSSEYCREYYNDKFKTYQLPK